METSVLTVDYRTAKVLIIWKYLILLEKIYTPYETTSF